MEVNMSKCGSKMWAIFLVAVITTQGICKAKQKNPEGKLYSDLLQNSGKEYNKNVRPPGNGTTVSIGPMQLQLIDLDEVKQVLHIKVYLSMVWVDVRFHMDPTDYGGIQTISLPSADIWRPDITLYNGYMEKGSLPTEVMAVVNISSGRVHWVPPLQLSSMCNVDLHKFPFDEQECKLKLGPWTYSHSKVRLEPLPPSQQTSYHGNSEWDLQLGNPEVSSTQKEHAKYDAVTYTLRLKRKSASYSSKMTFPAMAVGLMVPVIFVLPPESTAKITLGSGLLIAYLLMAIFFESLIPLWSHSVPYIVAYNLMCITFISGALVNAAIVITAASKSGKVPFCLRKIFLGFLGRMLCVRVDKRERHLDLETSGSDVSGRKMNEWKKLALVLDRLMLVGYALQMVVFTVVMLLI